MTTDYVTEIAEEIVDDLLGSDTPKEIRDAAIARTRWRVLTFALATMHSTTIQNQLMNIVMEE